MDRLLIKEIALENIGPFGSLKLSFREGAGITVICGGNGIGKTTILEAIAAPFSSSVSQRLKKKAGAQQGLINIQILSGNGTVDASATIKAFEPMETDWLNVLSPHARKLINVKTSRNLSYVRQDSLSRDQVFNNEEAAQRLAAGLSAHDIKKWFTSRYLLAHHGKEGGWTNAMVRNLEAATALFSALDPAVSLHGVDVRSFDINVNTPSGVIPFEYLSAGFRSAYVLLIGVVKEIELLDSDVAADEFSGVILIDEVDLHLHPTWQRRIAKMLTSTFPQAQIIATTHSPHVVQAAETDEVIALALGENGAVFERTLPSASYGFSGWTLDEVLEDVMGVSDTKSSEYRAAVAHFDFAVAADDANETANALEVLRNMLHPGNAYRKLLEIQAAPVMGNYE